MPPARGSRLHTGLSWCGQVQGKATPHARLPHGRGLRRKTRDRRWRRDFRGPTSGRNITDPLDHMIEHATHSCLTRSLSLKLWTLRIERCLTASASILPSRCRWHWRIETMVLTALVRAVFVNSPQGEGHDASGIDRFGILPRPAERGLSRLA